MPLMESIGIKKPPGLRNAAPNGFLPSGLKGHVMSGVRLSRVPIKMTYYESVLQSKFPRDVEEGCSLGREFSGSPPGCSLYGETASSRQLLVAIVEDSRGMARARATGTPPEQNPRTRCQL